MPGWGADVDMLESGSVLMASPPSCLVAYYIVGWWGAPNDMFVAIPTRPVVNLVPQCQTLPAQTRVTQKNCTLVRSSRYFPATSRFRLRSPE